MKKIIGYTFLAIILSIGIVFAMSNFSKSGENWDANLDPLTFGANDIFTLSGRLNIEDSNSENYINGYRGNIEGIINSKLFGNFDLIGGKLDLVKSNKTIPSVCSGATEVYDFSGSINSPLWGDVSIDNNSFFCSNQIISIRLKSNLLGIKDIGNISQNIESNDFGKQKIKISGVSNLKGNGDILANGNDGILKLSISNTSKTLAKKHLEKNIYNIIKSTYKSDLNIAKNIYNQKLLKPSDFKNLNTENYYIYKYNGNSTNINFSKGIGGIYKNKGDILQIGENSTNHIKISGKQNVIAEGGNIYIKSNTYNEDKNSLLIIVAKKDKDGNGGNIYIDSDITNIDAVLIADGSLISMTNNQIQELPYYKNNLRKQLLIYGVVLSSNNVGGDEVPFGADYYNKFTNNIIEKSIYDLANIRTFNLNYGIESSDCSDTTKLVPINGNGGILTYAWAGRKKCYNDDNGDPNLRKTNLKNPLVIEYNSMIDKIKPYLLQNN